MLQRMPYLTHQANSFEWLAQQQPNSFHAVVTDPPYGVVEFSATEIAKMRSGVGGIWRIPMEMGGSVRRPQPRFTVLTPQQKEAVEVYFTDWAHLLMPVLVPGAHVLMATNVLLSSRVQNGLEKAGFEYRGQIIRLYRGMRGGDRPKLAEATYPDVAVSLRGGHEPWLLFRKPLPTKVRVSENLALWGTGGLRRVHTDVPFVDVIQSERTPKSERLICDHPTIKPQSLMRPLTRLVLPLGQGTILDPFMGSGSTIAAAHAQGLTAVGVEMDPEFYTMANTGIPRLAQVQIRKLMRQEDAEEQPVLFDLA